MNSNASIKIINGKKKKKEEGFIPSLLAQSSLSLCAEIEQPQKKCYL